MKTQPKIARPLTCLNRPLAAILRCGKNLCLRAGEAARGEMPPFSSRRLLCVAPSFGTLMALQPPIHRRGDPIE